MKPTLALIAASCIFTAVAVAQPPNYTITDLGPVGGTPGQPFYIAHNGLISGAAAMPDGTMRAVLWYKGWRGDLGPLTLGGQNSVAFGVNERALTVGQAETSIPDPKAEDFCGFKQLGLPAAGTTCQPFIWKSGVTTALPTLGGNNGAANQINASGTVVGLAETATPDTNCPAPQVLQFKPVIWESGQVQELPVVAGDLNGAAFGINNHGQAVGASGDCGVFSPTLLVNLTALHAVLWDTGTSTDLGNLGGTGRGQGNVAFNLNNRGQVVGESDLPGDVTNHAFMWNSDTGMLDLGTLPGDVNSAGLGINDRGVVVGVSLDANFNLRAFFWQYGVMLDLNTLVPADSPLFLILACSINERGEIIGVGVNKTTGDTHAYIATPARSGFSSENAVASPMADQQKRFAKLVRR